MQLSVMSLCGDRSYPVLPVLMRYYARCHVTMCYAPASLVVRAVVHQIRVLPGVVAVVAVVIMSELVLCDGTKCSTAM